MAIHEEIKLFGQNEVRTAWDDEKEQWFFSVTDVVAILTDSADPKQYIKKLRARDPELDFSWGTICTLTRMKAADGKMYNTQSATAEGLFRIIQSIPSKKAEPIKQWLARVGQERLNQMQDPELGIVQAVKDYKRLGYSEKWLVKDGEAFGSLGFVFGQGYRPYSANRRVAFNRKITNRILIQKRYDRTIKQYNHS